MTDGLAHEPDVITLQLPELSVTALSWGDPDGRLALCLHGFPDSAWSWRHLGPALAARGFYVIAPFTRGYAPTSIPDDDDFSVGALMHDAISIHEHVGGGTDAVLIGHDWGSITANALGASELSPFSTVVSLSVPPVPAMTLGFRTSATDSIAAQALTLLRQMRMSWYIGFVQIPGVSERSLGRLIPRLWHDWSPGFDATEDLAHVFDTIGESPNRRAALRYYRSVASPRRPAQQYRSLQRTWTKDTRVRTLYLHGADDGCMQASYAAPVLSVLPPGSRVEIIPNAGHFLQVEQPEMVNDSIIRFLEDTQD